MAINPNSFRGDLYYDINYDDVNRFLQARNPYLKLNPGHTSLAVSARWSNGHQAGGFGRGGVFRLPPSGQTHSVIGVRSAQRTSEETDLPLDMQVAFPPALVQAAPGLVVELVRAEREPLVDMGDRLITLVRIDPARYRFRLLTAAEHGARPAPRLASWAPART